MRALLLNWALTASLLVFVVLVLRAVFGRRMGARLRYALWLPVLVRLLVPGQFFTAPVETPRALPELRTVQTLPAGRRLPAGREPAPGGELPAQAVPSPAGEEEPAAPSARKSVNVPALLGGIWLAGSAAMTAAFVLSNWSFSRKLRRVRMPLEAVCPLPVYVAPGLPSPCLFGMLRPAVYVTPETAADPVILRHVLIHETTHYRQGDHVWSLLRCGALAVHWWNPLMWLAAVLSRRDAELACDEGTLKVLGDGERRAYGNTLLALVTARAQPGDLLRCATTMTGDKRSLRERVSRIARAPRRWLWAAVLSVGLAALVCACSFAKTAEKHEDGPLTAEELEQFNNEFSGGDGFSIRNQFLFLAVEAPKDYRQIDLFQLFYNGTGLPGGVSEEERRAVAEASGGDPELDLIKCPAGEMDEILREYLGLGLEDTDKWGLDQFTYLEEYDAYYHFHSDSNAHGPVEFTSGEWKDGKALLYYTGEYFPVLSNGDGSWIFPEEAEIPACVTLEPQRDGGYHFLSNWRCDPPAVPTAYPAWDPERVIPLDGLEPYEPEAVAVERRTGDVAESLYRTRFEPDEFSSDGYDIEVYRSADGSLCAAVVVSETERDCFLTIPAGASDTWTAEDSVEPFTNLFGQYGLWISYYGWLDERYYGTFNDYYIFTEDGAPSLLLRAKGEVRAIDLDGDGEDELTSDGGDCSYLFFRRDGRLCQAEVHSLIQEVWPESGYKTFGFWDREGRFLPCAVEVPLPGADVTVTAYRDIFFDGENLRIYKDEGGYTDHIANGLEAIPADVVRQAALFADTQFQALAAEGYGTDGSGDYSEGHFGPGNVVWDDWRLTGLSGPWYETAGDLRVEIWNVSYETHTTTPDRVMLAGGSYMGEDGWCMIGYPGCDYLYFRLDENGNRTYLYSAMENDCSPGTEVFLSDMVSALTDQGLLKLSDLDGETLAKIMRPQSAQFLNALAEGDALERDKVLLALGPYFLREEGPAEYADFAAELNPGGYLAGELTDGGRAAWEELRGFVDWFTPDSESSVARAQAMRENEGRVSEMALPELLEYASKSDGATAESAFSTLHQRFREDPAAVLAALAAREDSLPLAYMLGLTIFQDEDLFPGALERARALELDGEEAALRDRIAAVCEARRQALSAG